MMSIDELRQAEGELKSRIEHLHEFLHIDDRKAEMAELEAKMSAPDFWNDKESAQNTVSQLSACRNLLEPFRKLESEIEDYSVALELAGEDEEFLKETEIAYRRLLKSLDRMEIMSFLSGVTAGLFGINMLFLIYLERTAKGRQEFRANVCFVFFLENLFRTIVYIYNGIFTAFTLQITLVTIPAAFLGMWIGSQIDKHIDEKRIKKLIIYVFILGGLSTLIKALLFRA